MEEKKKNNLRLKAIISQIEFIIYFIYGHHELATNVVFSEARKEIIRFRNDLSSLIANLRVYDINDLLKLNCKFTDMMNLSFFLDKYNISIAGIIDLNSPEQEKITDNKERLDKIVKELKDKL